MKLNYFLLSFIMAFQLHAAISRDDFVLDLSTKNYDQQHIELDLRFDFENEKVFGTATLRICLVVDDLSEVVLHSKLTKILEVRVSNKKLKFETTDDLLFIRLNRKYQRNEILEVEIEYESGPAKGLYFHYPTESEPQMPYQIWSQGQGEDNRYWFPAFDLPGDKMQADIIITVPQKFQVISNGTLISVEENSKNKEKTYHWCMDYEQVSYLISIVIGEFFTVSDTVRGVPLDYHVPVEFKDANLDLVFGRTPVIFDFFCDYLGAYPYKKYAQTPVHDFKYGGMENASATTLNERIFHDERAIPNYSPVMLIAHEMAHQWFGDLITVETWPHFWLHEGFATYLTDLYFEHQDGVDDFRLRRLEQNRKYFESRLKSPVEKIDASSEPFTPIDFLGGFAYFRGAAILHMLRYELGDELFKSGLQHYVRKFRFGNVVSEDFRQVMEEISGRDLTQFFKQWVYGAGHPHFEVSWQWADSTKRLALFVKQTQPELPTMGTFEMTVPIEIVAGAERIERRLSITQREQVFTYSLQQKPDWVRFNKYFWNLAEVDFKKSFEELSNQLLLDDDVVGRCVAAEQIVAFPEKAAAVLGKAFQREPHQAVRAVIVKSLGEPGKQDGLAVLKRAAMDLDPRVREETMKALANFEAADVAEILKSHITEEKNDYVRGAALAALGRIGANGAFEILSDALKFDSHNNIIRTSVFDGFQAMADSQALPFAKEYVKYKYSSGGMHLLEKSIMSYAESMIETHRLSALEAFMGAVTCPYYRVRYQAGGLLKKYNAKEVVPELKNLLKNSQRKQVRSYLKSLIEYLETM